MSSGLIQFAVELIFGSCCRRSIHVLCSVQSDSYRKIAPDDGLDSRKRRGGSSDRGDDNDAIVVFLSRPIYILSGSIRGVLILGRLLLVKGRREKEMFCLELHARWRCGSGVTFNPGTASEKRASEGRLRFSHVCEQTIPRASERPILQGGQGRQKKLYCYFFGCEQAAIPSIVPFLAHHH